MDKTIIGIDPGKMGGIAVANNGSLKIVNMPKSSRELFRFLQSVKGEDNFCVLEKVGMFRQDNEEGRGFGIAKLLAQAQSIKTVLEILEIPYIEIASVTWQSRLKFKKIKGESKSERKRKYWEWAKNFAPQNNFNIPLGDAVCILACGMKLIKENDILIGGAVKPEEELF